MDYEKKYKEALERAEKALEVFGTDKCEGARQIFSLFPELRESEDEKVRKGIKSILEHYKESGEVVCPYPFVSIDKALAWLEKQGEQKSAWNEEDEEMLTEIITDVKFAQDEFAKKKSTITDESNNL